ncbi:hypothetical protein [Nitrospina watsonii]|uniref:Uncharacterized protein n=1 Tax=Nitrospina watsonii TaxID=1323948 RepID=A0ABM9HCW8_9BACT|nr:hypothetical protein [Nitrospina watsonii]CAI2717985.1 conserved protein of unknown function [Nitrospina watsonii]
MMTPFQARKGALVFAVFAFTLLTAGSLFMGARLWVAMVRGIEGFCLFGVLAWGIGALFATRNESAEQKAENKKKGQNLDQTV